LLAADVFVLLDLRGGRRGGDAARRFALVFEDLLDVDRTLALELLGDLAELLDAADGLRLLRGRRRLGLDALLRRRRDAMRRGARRRAVPAFGSDRAAGGRRTGARADRGRRARAAKGRH